MARRKPRRRSGFSTEDTESIETERVVIWAWSFVWHWGLVIFFRRVAPTPHPARSASVPMKDPLFDNRIRSALQNHRPLLAPGECPKMSQNVPLFHDFPYPNRRGVHRLSLPPTLRV